MFVFRECHFTFYSDTHNRYKIIVSKLFCENFAKYDETNKMHILQPKCILTYIFEVKNIHLVVENVRLEAKNEVNHFILNILYIRNIQKWPISNTRNRYEIIALKLVLNICEIIV